MAQNSNSEQEPRPTLTRLGKGGDYLSEEPFATRSSPTSLNREKDWDLHRTGVMDSQRHEQLVRELIDQGLSEELGKAPDFGVIDPDKKITVKTSPERIEWYFRFNPNGKNRRGVGMGDGTSPGDGKTQVGDVIPKEPGPKGTKGAGLAGEGDAEYEETEVVMQQYLDRVFEELELPLSNRPSADFDTPDYELRSIGKVGVQGNLDKKRTVMENIKRNAAKGEPGFHDLKQEDHRYKAWVETPHPVNAVVIAMMDFSESMGEAQKEAAKALLMLQYLFLKTRYPKVQMVFIAHAQEAKEIDTAKKFFSVVGGLGNGTQSVTAFALANHMIKDRFNPKEYDIFPVYAGDGEDTTLFSAIRDEEVGKLIDASVQFTFAETLGLTAAKSRLRQAITTVAGKSEEKTKRFFASRLADSADALRMLRDMYPKGGRRSAVTVV